MANAIEFENVSKQYRLGLVGTGTLAHDIRRFWVTNILRQEDPYLKIGETNDRTSKGNSDYVWALRDITFNVEQGDVVGIIGKNGAGKSTLLKLLSRVTGPTTGTIRAHGRIGSLLEVGTGFHQEMTGRENIFLNGAILGMTHNEIQRKLDEIVDFSGCERYIDTPVKRYSSGMSVRLGFAVAAHLEPEILVVDEVLAVGDAEFQKKAIGKMQDVAGNGRTVLFVSHNMASIKKLCKHGVLLENGMVKNSGEVNDIIEQYLSENWVEAGDVTEVDTFERLVQTTKDFEITHLTRCMPYKIDNSHPITYRVRLKKHGIYPSFRISTLVNNLDTNERVGMAFSEVIDYDKTADYMDIEVSYPNHSLAKGRYILDVWVHQGDAMSSYKLNDAVYNTLTFEVDSMNNNMLDEWHNYWGSIIAQQTTNIL